MAFNFHKYISMRKSNLALIVKIGKTVGSDFLRHSPRQSGGNIAFCNYSRLILIVKRKITLLSKLAKH